MRSVQLFAALLTAALGFIRPAISQGQTPRPDSAAGPAPIAKSGAITLPTALERRMLEEVKAPAGFTTTLFAGPPAAMYPTCLTAAPEGVVFVCVDPNLSLSVGKGWGRVMRLVDENGDGRADRYTVFAEVDSPRGVAFDGQTLYVMHPPNLTAYRDTDGDGIADRSETLVRGLGFDLDFRGADHTTNGITLGIDGWIYVAVGDYGFRKAIGRDGTQLGHRGGSVVRVRPDGTNLELYTVGTRNIYDLAIDPMMRLFTRDNTNDGDGWNTRLHYLPRRADLGYPSLYRNFSSEHFPTLFDYGAGSGTGGIWIHDPRWPQGFDNTLYTADWTVNKVFRHRLTPKGASFAVEQEDFLSVVRPADLALDTRGNLYVASLSGGQFTYRGDSIGYVFRITPAGGPSRPEPSLGSATDAQLVDALLSASSEQRLYAQQEILRRGSRDATVRRLEQAIQTTSQPAYARTAALFTLKQLTGARSHATLQRAAADPALRAVALRALVDRPAELAGVPTSLFVSALKDTDPHVRMAAVDGLARLGARDAAEGILALARSSDPAEAHLAVRALVELGATDVALRALDRGDAATRAAALRVLQGSHDLSTVAALSARLSTATDPATRRALLGTLARLYHQEGEWLGDWWGTRPAFAGPYFDPAAWEGSARIRPVLRQALLAAQGAELEQLAEELARNRVLPTGSKDLLVALTASRSPQRTAVIDALVGRKEIDAGSVPLLVQLDASSPALHRAVALMVGAQGELPPTALPLLRGAVLDAGLPGEVRAPALAAAGRIPGPEGLRVASELFSRTVPGSNPDADVEQSWRRYVGDRARAAQADHFIVLTQSAVAEERVLGYSVLVQLARAPRTPAPVKEKVTRAIEQAWTSRAATESVARAIRVMGAEELYQAQLTSAGNGAATQQ